MTLAISVALVGSSNPQAVQVSVTGATSGVDYTISASTTDDQWAVRGGNPATADSTQVVVVDVAAPINVPVTYQATDGTTTVTASPLTVPFDGQEVLTSLDGRLTVSPLRLRNNGAPRALVMRQSTFAIPGRLLPVVRFDVPGGETGQLIIDTADAESDNMWALMRQGGLCILRTDGQLRDLPSVQFLLVAPSTILDDVDDVRIWTLDYQVVSDPEPDAVVAAVTWDDFDAAYAALTWSDFNTEWSSATWDAFDKVDWSAR